MLCQHVISVAVCRRDKEPPATFLSAVHRNCSTCQKPTAANTAFANSAREFYRGGSGLAGSRTAPSGGLRAGWSETVSEGESGLIALAATVSNVCSDQPSVAMPLGCGRVDYSTIWLAPFCDRWCRPVASGP